MTGHVYALASGKGGVGKTTSALNLGAALRGAGYDTVILDADLPMANLGALLDIEDDPTLHDVLAGETTLNDALVWLPTESPPTRTPPGEDTTLVVVPGSRSLESFAAADPGGLRRVIHSLAAAADFVVCDTGAGLSHENAVPLGVADGVVLVTTPDPVAIEDAKKTAEFTARAGGSVVGAVLTRAGEETDVSAITERLGVPMLAVIPESAVVGDEPLVETAPESYAAEAYQRLATALADHDEPTGENQFTETILTDQSDDEESGVSRVVGRLSGAFNRSENR
ncbi:MAG TPA: MinD/ParA family protein [Halococcus sp.]|nr:MinD/ParA family protein [Halococcus sp.]